MCGIVGCIGSEDTVSFLLQGLKRLEYRGYDSAGLATIYRKKIKAIKKVGKVAALEMALPPNLKGRIGIAHTRWATHGKISESNAHPQISANGNFAVVHNGIIENSGEIRKRLEAEGYHFTSETDTEVIPAFLESKYNGDPEEAVFEVIKEIQGAYGLAIMVCDSPESLILVRKGSPLVMGLAEDGAIAASDTSALLGYARQVVYLNDYEIATMTAKKIETKNFQRIQVVKSYSEITSEEEEFDKGDFEHFMLREIYDQPDALEACMAGRLSPDGATVKLGGLNMTRQELFALNHISFIACGTSYNASLVGSYIIEEIARIKCSVEIASEIASKNPIIEKNSLYFALSQSGETADTLFAMRELQRKGARVLGICNRVGSTIPRESDGGIYLHSGKETAVASTKAFTAQILAISLVAILLGRMREISFARGNEFIEEIRLIPSKIKEILDGKEKIEKIAKVLSQCNRIVFIGRGISYPIALEGALKVKETSYINAEGFAGGEIKHGPIALIDKKTPAVCIAPRNALWEKSLSDIEVLKSRKAPIIIIGEENDKNLIERADHFIGLPKTYPLFSPLLTAIPLQLLAYYTALNLGRDIDKPRNLAKSVTV